MSGVTIKSEGGRVTFEQTPVSRGATQSLSAEVTALSGCAADYSSQLRIFGWTSIDGVLLPYIVRKGVKFVSVSMVEAQVLSKFNATEYPRVIQDRPPLSSRNMTLAESVLLNEVNSQHCDFLFGTETYTSRDTLVELGELEDFYDELKKALNDNSATSSPALPNGEVTAVGGWIQFETAFVPYVRRSEGDYLLPLSVVKFAALIDMPTPPDACVASVFECMLLSWLCHDAGMEFEFTPAHTVLVSAQTIQRHSGSYHLRHLPGSVPFVDAFNLPPVHHNVQTQTSEPSGPLAFVVTSSIQTVLQNGYSILTQPAQLSMIATQGSASALQGNVFLSPLQGVLPQGSLVLSSSVLPAHNVLQSFQPVATPTVYTQISVQPVASRANTTGPSDQVVCAPMFVPPASTAPPQSQPAPSTNTQGLTNLTTSPPRILQPAQQTQQGGNVNVVMKELFGTKIPVVKTQDGKSYVLLRYIMRSFLPGCSLEKVLGGLTALNVSLCVCDKFITQDLAGKGLLLPDQQEPLYGMEYQSLVDNLPQIRYMFTSQSPKTNGNVIRGGEDGRANKRCHVASSKSEHLPNGKTPRLTPAIEQPLEHQTVNTEVIVLD